MFGEKGHFGLIFGPKSVTSRYLYNGSKNCFKICNEGRKQVDPKDMTIVFHTHTHKKNIFEKNGLF